jgi:hypothetical protein
VPFEPFAFQGGLDAIVDAVNAIKWRGKLCERIVNVNYQNAIIEVVFVFITMRAESSFLATA